MFVVVFSLLHNEDVEEEEAEAEAEAEAAKAGKSDESKDAGTKHEGENDFEPQEDDLD